MLLKVRLAWPERAILGIAVTVVAGGIFNIAGVISRPLLLAFAGAGLICFLTGLAAERPRFHCPFLFHQGASVRIRIFFWAVVVLAAGIYLSAVKNAHFSACDDYSGYLVFSQKMLQTGGLGTDPFSERRILASLGGPYFLDALSLAAAPLNCIHMIDEGWGRILFFAVLALWCARTGVSPRWTAALLVLSFLTLLSDINSTSVHLPAAIFLFLASYLDGPPAAAVSRRGPSDAVIVAFAAATILLLKSNLIIAAAVFLGSFYGTSALRSPFKAVHGIAVLGLVLLFASPWMVSMRISSGTFLYPIFGRGYHMTRYGLPILAHLKLTAHHIRMVRQQLLTDTPHFVACLALTVILGISGIAVRTRVAWTMLAASLVSAVGVGVLLRGWLVHHYTGSFLYAGSFCGSVVLARGVPRPGLKWLTKTGLVSVAAYLVFCNLGITQRMANTIVTDLHRPRVSQCVITDDIRSHYAELQAAVPPGERLLATLDYACILDFKRNPVWLADMPGCSSLPPGIPLDRGAAATAEYLMSKGVRYVAFSQEWNYNLERLSAPSGIAMISRYDALATAWTVTEDYIREMTQLSRTNTVFHRHGLVLLDLAKS